MRALAKKETLSRKTVSLILTVALCAQPVLAQKTGQTSSNPASQYPNYKKPTPHKDKDGNVVPNTWDVTICKGTEFVVPIPGKEASVQHIHATETFPTGDATAHPNGNSIVIVGRHATPRSNGFSILEMDVGPSDGSAPAQHVTFNVQVIDCDQLRTAVPPPKTNTAIGNAGTPGQKPVAGGAAANTPNTAMTPNVPSAPAPNSPNSNPSGANPQGTNPAGTNPAGANQPAGGSNAGGNGAGGNTAAGGNAGGQPANPGGQPSTGGAASQNPCPDCGQLLTAYHNAKDTEAQAKEALEAAPETVNAAQDAMSLAGNALSLAKGTPGEAAAQAKLDEETTKFEAAKKALQTAQGDYNKAHDAAVAAEKAYDDCMQQKKNCPPPSTPATGTGASSLGTGVSPNAGGAGGKTGGNTGTGGTSGTGGTDGTGGSNGAGNAGGASTAGGVFNPVSAMGGSTGANAVSVSPAVYVYQLVVTSGSVNEPSTPGVVTAGGTPATPPNPPGNAGQGNGNNGGANNGNNNNPNNNPGSGNNGGSNGGNGSGNDGGRGGAPFPKKDKGQLPTLPFAGCGNPAGNNSGNNAGAGAGKNGAAVNGAPKAGGPPNQTLPGNTGTSPSAGAPSGNAAPLTYTPPPPSDIDRQTAKALCDQAQQLRNQAAQDADKSTHATDPKTRDDFAAQSIRQENAANQREQLARHYDPDACPPTGVMASAGGSSNSGGTGAAGNGPASAAGAPASGPGTAPAAETGAANGSGPAGGRPAGITIHGVTYYPLDPVQAAMDRALDQSLEVDAQSVPGRRDGSAVTVTEGEYRKIANDALGPVLGTLLNAVVPDSGQFSKGATQMYTGQWVDNNGNPISPSTIKAGLLVRRYVLQRLDTAVQKYSKLQNKFKNMTVTQKIGLVNQLQHLAGQLTPTFQAYTAVKNNEGLKDDYIKHQKELAEYQEQVKLGVAVRVEEVPVGEPTRTAVPPAELAGFVQWRDGRIQILESYLRRHGYQQYLNARNAFVQALNATDPLLGVQEDGTGPYLFEQLLHGSPGDKIDALDNAISQATGQLQQQFNDLNKPPSVNTLIQMGADQYAQSAATAAASGGDFTKLLVDGLQAEHQGMKGVEAYGKAYSDFLLAEASALPVVGIPFMLAQVFFDGKDYYVAVTDEKNAQALAPIEGYQPVAEATEVRQDAGAKFATSAVTTGGALGLQAVNKALQAGKTVKVVYRFHGRSGMVVLDAKSAGRAAAVAGDAKGTAVVQDATAATATNAASDAGGTLSRPISSDPLIQQQQLDAFINQQFAGTGVQEVKLQVNLARKAGVPAEQIQQILQDFNPNDTLGTSNLMVAKGLNDLRLQTLGYELDMPGSEFSRVQQLSVRAGPNGVGLTPQDVQWLQQQVDANPNYFNDFVGKDGGVRRGITTNYSNATLARPMTGPNGEPLLNPQNNLPAIGGITKASPPEFLPVLQSPEDVLAIKDAFVAKGGKLPPTGPGVSAGNLPPSNTPAVNLPAADNAATVKLTPRSNTPTVNLGTPDIPPASTRPTTKLGTPDIPPVTETPTVRPGPISSTPNITSPGSDAASLWKSAKGQSPQLQTFEQYALAGKGLTPEQVRDLVMDLKSDPAAMRSLKNASEEVRDAFNTAEANVYKPANEAAMNQVASTAKPNDPWAGRELRIHEFRTPRPDKTFDPLSINTDRDFRMQFKNDKGEWIEVPRDEWQKVWRDNFATAEVSGYTPDKLRQMASPQDVKAWDSWNSAQHNGQTVDEAMKKKWMELHQQLATDRFHPEAGADFADQARIEGQLREVGNNINSVKEGATVLKDAEQLGMMSNEKADAYFRLTDAAHPDGFKLEGMAQLNKGTKLLGEVRAGYQKLYGSFGQDAPIGKLSPRFQKAADAIKTLAPFDKTITPQQITQVENQLRELGFGTVANPGNPLKDFKEALDAQFQSLKTVPGPIGPVPPPPAKPPGGGMMRPSDREMLIGFAGRERSQVTPSDWASFSGGFFPATTFTASDLAPGTIVRLVAKETSAEPPTGEVSFSIVANGKSSGEAFELQVIDPTGKVKQIAMPEGVVLAPLRTVPAKSAAVKTVGNMLTKQLTAYCLDFAKLPPEPGMLYRIAPQALQEKFKPIRSVLQAGRELAAGGRLHPDSDPQEYANDIRQYALWSKLENWGEPKFSEMFLEHTKKNAQAMKVKWTKQMEQAVLGLAPGRWRDVAMVLEEAEKLSQGSPRPGSQ
jgi:hypothetical protein